MKRTVVCLTIVSVLGGLAVAGESRKKERRAQRKRAAAKRVEAATDPDFTLQGEYAGVVRSEGGGTMKVGVQVITWGPREGLEAVVHPGGLPGAGWAGTDKKRLKGRREDGGAVFGDAKNDGWVIKDESMQRILNGAVLGTLRKVYRESPTLGLKPPAGAVVLFDGTTAEHFKNGRMNQEKLLMQGTTSKREFHDHILHIEFRIPYQPTRKGQGRGNSGVYLQGRYEVQILDSFGLKGENNECGGIYSVAKPRVNMCFPPLRWQTYDVQLTAARYKDGKRSAHPRMTVYHNGVLVHENQEITKTFTTAAPITVEGERGPLYLQAHGAPVRYRNIWILEVTDGKPVKLANLMQRWTRKE